MTISTNSRNDAVGNGATAVYPYGFKIFDATDLRVTVQDDDGDETVLTYPTDYTVSGVGSAAGGNVTLAGSGHPWQDGDGDLLTGYRITVRRVVPLNQTTDIRNQGGYRPTTIEDTFDRTVMQIQQISDEVDRSVRVAETASDVDTTLPVPTPGSAIGWNATGDALVNVALATGTSLVDLAAADGLGLIGFTPAGSGVTTRTAQEKLREIHRSVKDQGAVASTTIDSTAAFQACVDYHIANRIQTMYIPTAGALYYRLTDTITIAGRLNIVGDAEFTTTIWADGFTAGQPIFSFVNAAVDVVEGCLIQDITLRSDDGNATGLHIENISHVDLLRVTLYNLTDGIEITGDRTFSISAKQVKATSIGGRTVRYYSFAGGGQHNYDTCTFTGADGFFVENTAVLDSLNMINCNFEQCDTTDFTCEGTIRGLNVPSGRSEGFGGTVSFNINPSVGNVVKGYVHQGFNWASDSGNAYCIGIGGDVEGFVIQANTGSNIGMIAAVLLNGAGASGVIQANNFEDSPAVVNANRAGVRVLSNKNSSGDLPEYGGKSGTFTATGTGFASAPTATARYSVGDGSVVSLVLPQLSGTSNADTFTVTGMPTDARPAADRDMVGFALDNGGSFAPCLVRVKTTGVIEIYYTLSASNWTTSGTKTLYGSVLTYPLI